MAVAEGARTLVTMGHSFGGAVAMMTEAKMNQLFKIEPAAEFDDFTARLTARYCNPRKATIYAGSNEIQRNIIAKLTLGLPGGAQ